MTDPFCHNALPSRQRDMSVSTVVQDIADQAYNTLGTPGFAEPAVPR